MELMYEMRWSLLFFASTFTIKKIYLFIHVTKTSYTSTFDYHKPWLQEGNNCNREIIKNTIQHEGSNKSYYKTWLHEGNNCNCEIIKNIIQHEGSNKLYYAILFAYLKRVLHTYTSQTKFRQGTTLRNRYEYLLYYV